MFNVKVEDFVHIVENKSSFEINDLVHICKRENNKKREFLFVNRYQGKHIPTQPSKTLKLFNELWNETKKKLSKNEKVLMVAFAETATAIGESLCRNALSEGYNITQYVQTTRENIDENFELFNFSEEHSHATEQKIYFKEKLKDFDTVLFVEDEITTGNTIINFIKQFDKLVPNKKYIVSSLLNWQNEESQSVTNSFFESVWLVKGILKQNIPTLNIKKTQKFNFYNEDALHIERKTPFYNNPRLSIGAEEIIAPDLDVVKKLNIKEYETVLVIGTEEYMYYPLMIASAIETMGNKVLFRATTRSPIETSDEEGYLVKNGVKIHSIYNSKRVNYLYNTNIAYDRVIVVSDVLPNKYFEDNMNKIFGEKVDYIINGKIKDFDIDNLVKTSYSKKDVIILLQDINGKVPILDNKTREKLNQGGVHYSEMLPLESLPSDKYSQVYNMSLKELSLETAKGVALLSEKIVKKHGSKAVIVSLARAGTPIGILVKRYIKYKYGFDVPHYSISIIRGKGIDVRAMDLIVEKHGARNIQFLDGWIGKGAICNVLRSACKELKSLDDRYNDLSPELAVLNDPANETEMYGTRQDFLIPSACLNSIVSGLVSRTVKLKTMTDNELHGAVYYDHFESDDRSLEFIDTVCSYFDKIDSFEFEPSVTESDPNFKGIDEVTAIAKDYDINDINKVKPGVGETTRVLLRRIPDRILISKDANHKYLKHILTLCEEKNVPVEEYPLQKYNVCGIIKDVSDL